MSKVNVDEIKEGDLVEIPHDGARLLCYVTDIDKRKGRVYGIWSDNFKKDWDYTSKLTGHWKVINFEEKSKMDELKVYTGKETIEAFLEGKTLTVKNVGSYKLEDGKLLYLEDKPNSKWYHSQANFNTILFNKFTEVATPQVGDWVRVTHRHYEHIAKIERLAEGCMWADWENRGKQTFYRVDQKGVDWEILSPEEVSEYKREQAFIKVGRKLNEFKANDIVYIEAVNRTAIVVSSNNETDIRLHSINVGEVGHTAKPHQLTPVCFVDHMVDLS